MNPEEHLNPGESIAATLRVVACQCGCRRHVATLHDGADDRELMTISTIHSSIIEQYPDAYAIWQQVLMQFLRDLARRHDGRLIGGVAPEPQPVLSQPLLVRKGGTDVH